MLCVAITKFDELFGVMSGWFLEWTDRQLIFERTNGDTENTTKCNLRNNFARHHRKSDFD